MVLSASLGCCGDSGQGRGERYSGSASGQASSPAGASIGHRGVCLAHHGRYAAGALPELCPTVRPGQAAGASDGVANVVAAGRSNQPVTCWDLRVGWWDSLAVSGLAGGRVAEPGDWPADPPRSLEHRPLRGHTISTGTKYSPSQGPWRVANTDPDGLVASGRMFAAGPGQVGRGGSGCRYKCPGGSWSGRASRSDASGPAPLPARGGTVDHE